MKIEVDVPDGISGEWEIKTVEKKHDPLGDIMEAYHNAGRYVPPGTYKKLICEGATVMSNTPDEINDFRFFLQWAEGSILINGLGLGVLLKGLAEKEELTDITVIELSLDVVKLVGSTFANNPKIEIIQGDAFEWQPPKGKRYTCVWHDIWNTICSDNIEEMKKLHRKYGRKAGYQGSWCRKECERLRREDRKIEKENEMWASILGNQVLELN